MKKSFNALSLAMVSLLAIFCAGLTSCSEDDSPETSDKQQVFVINPQDSGEYDFTLFDLEHEEVIFMDFDEQKRLINEDILYNNGQSKMRVTYYENGLVRSICDDTQTLVFSNYSGTCVDIAVIRDSEMQIIKEHECGVDWDQQVGNANSPRMAPRFASQNQDDQNAVDVVSGYMDEFSTYLDDHKHLSILATAIEGTVEMAIIRKPKVVFQWSANLHVDVVDLSIQDQSSNTQYAILLTELAINSNPVGLAFTLITNYNTVEDYFTEVWLMYFNWMDALGHNDNVDLGISALNSGNGNLKVTLSWGFYADIDLHAIEPNGTRIYYNNEYSYRTGGYLDVDNRRGGPGACENIYWEEPENGTYNIGVHYYGESTYNGMSQCGVCKVTIMYKGHGKVYDVPMNNEDDYQNVTSIDVPTGALYRNATEQSPHIRFELSPKRPVSSSDKAMR